MTDAAVSDPPAGTSFLDTPPAAPAPVVPIAPATPAGTPQAASFFSDAHKQDGKFKEGWSEAFGKAGLSRLEKWGQKFNDEGEFLKSLDHTLQFIGGKGALPRPEADAPAETWAAYRKQQGAPDDPKGYGFKPDKLPDGMEWDDALGGEFEQLLHKHNIPAEFGKEASGFYAKVLESTQAKAQANYDARLAEAKGVAEAHFKKEWGEEFPQRVQNNALYAKSLGLDTNDPVIAMALSNPTIINLLDGARRELRGKLPGAGSELNGSSSPKQEAEAEMAKNPNWQRDPVAHAKITRLMELHATQQNFQG